MSGYVILWECGSWEWVEDDPYDYVWVNREKYGKYKYSIIKQNDPLSWKMQTSEDELLEKIFGEGCSD